MLLLIAVKTVTVLHVLLGLPDYLLINDYLMDVCLSVSSVGAVVCLVLFILVLMPNIVNEGNQNCEQN